jgi:hypothetical protein
MATVITGEELMTAVDAGRILGLSSDMVRVLAREGKLRAAVATTRGVRLFRRHDVEALAAERAGGRAHVHIAQLYEDPAFLIRQAAEFLADGLRTGGPVIVFATEPRRRALLEQLELAGVDAKRAVETGRLATFDARETLERFVREGALDAARFREHVGALIEGRAEVRTRLRVYGEMVDLLCKDGLVDAAVSFEQLWNELARSHRLSRLCAYDLGHFKSAEDSRTFARIAALHSRVVPTERYAEAPDEESRLRQIALWQLQAHALGSEESSR